MRTNSNAMSPPAIVAIPDDPADPPTDIQVGTHQFQQEYLFGFAPAHEVLGYVRSQAAEDDRRRSDEIMAAWTKVQPRVQRLIVSEAGLPDTVPVVDVPAHLTEMAEEFAADPLFKRAFQLPIEVRYVEIDRIVAYQRAVHLGYIERLTQQLGPKPSDEGVLRLCVSPQRDMDPIQHLAMGNAAHTFSSPNSDIRFLGAYLKRDLTAEDHGFAEGGGLPAAAIIAFVGYGTPMVNAFTVGGRVILNNGFHRIVALRRLGVERIPLVLQTVQNPDLELPPELGGIARDYLLRHPRPALVKDFMEDGFTIKLQVRERMRVLNLGVQVGAQDVPV